MIRCRVFGHRVRFRADGDTMRWECERGCGHRGSKRYASAAAARRYAAAFSPRENASFGRRPMLSLVPLWLARQFGRNRSDTQR